MITIEQLLDYNARAVAMKTPPPRAETERFVRRLNSLGLELPVHGRRHAAFDNEFGRFLVDRRQ